MGKQHKQLSEKDPAEESSFRRVFRSWPGKILIATWDQIKCIQSHNFHMNQWNFGASVSFKNLFLGGSHQWHSECKISLVLVVCHPLKTEVSSRNEYTDTQFLKCIWRAMKN